VGGAPDRRTEEDYDRLRPSAADMIIDGSAVGVR
jgi:hypothetical protein